MPRFRFSLRSFFLVLFIGCLVGSNLFTAREMHRLNEKLNESHRENEKLQAELGQLVVTDPAILHVVAIPSYEATTWRWRLHVPADGRYRIRLATHEIPETGIPTSPHVLDLNGGESELTAAIRKDRNDDWAMNMIVTQRSANGSSSQRQSLPMAPEHSKWVAESSGSSTSQAGASRTDSMTPGEPMVLLRHRIMRALGDGSSGTVPEPSDGVMIWIVEEGK
jgi:hypothetical protein